MYFPLKKGAKSDYPIVIEFGAQTTRAGVAGEERPTIVKYTEIGSYPNKETNGLNYVTDLEPYTDPMKEGLRLFNPFNNYAITDMAAVEVGLGDIFAKLPVDVKESPVLMVEPPFHNRDTRLKYVEMLFEKFNTSGVTLHKSPLLSLYVYGKENALIIDSGGLQTFCTPIVEGFMNTKAIVKSDIAGEYFTTQFMNKVTSRGSDIKPFFMNNKGTPSCKELENFSRRSLAREIKHGNMKLLEYRVEDLKFNEVVDNVMYDLPDHNKIELSREMYTIPELMFSAINEYNFKGYHNLVIKSLEMTDSEARRELLSNIFVCGGNTCIQNFPERLQIELMNAENNWGLGSKVKVFSRGEYYERQHCAWLGGSILASMGTFGQLVMTREEYDEHGALLIERKAYS